MTTELKIWIKKLLSPSFVGILVLIVVSVVFIIIKGSGGVAMPSLLSRAQSTRSQTPVAAQQAVPEQPAPVPGAGGNSYHLLVDLIRPAVVGISLPGAQPFLQAWPGPRGMADPTFPGATVYQCPICKTIIHSRVSNAPPRCPTCGGQMQQSLAQGPVGLTAICPICGQPMTRQPGQPWSTVRCTRCGKYPFCALGQMQAWTPYAPAGGAPAVTPAAVTPPTTQKTDEYLLCPNCGIKIYQTPGIPWAGAMCPACHTVMAHIIRETTTPAAPPPDTNIWGQPEALTPNQQQALQTPQAAPSAIGAGIIVSQRGYVLTNYHLVANQPDIIITIFTPQGAQTFAGVVEMASQPDDLAILRIVGNVPPGLPTAVLGNSDAVNIGDTVLALGNPFGLTQTVTDGIISARRKSIDIDGVTYQNIFQTDAPINPGNAGGPLVNMKGEVIGVNTASFAPMQTNTGLGFAIPINRAQATLSAYLDPPTQAQLAALRSCPVPQGFPLAAQQAAPGIAPQVPVVRQQAPVVRQRAPIARAPAPAVLPPAVVPDENSPAWVGVEFQLMNDVLAEQMKVPFDRGILITQVFPNSPAAISGLERGDIVYQVDGRRINDETQLRLFLADKKPGDLVKLVIFRAGKKVSIDLQLTGGSIQQAAAALAPKPTDLLAGSEIEAGTADIVSLGLTVDKITPDVAFAFKLPQDTTGVVISAVEGLSMAQGVREGDVITSVDGRAIPDLLSLYKSLKKTNLITGVDLGLTRNGELVHVVVKDNPTPTIQGV